jgi:GDP-L-fucose synthase
MDKDSKIFVAGGSGLVGSAITRELLKEGFTNIIVSYHNRPITPYYCVGFIRLDCTDQNKVNEFFAWEKPEYVFLCAARVGGIMANSTHQADFIYENLMISTNIIEAARKNGVKKLLNMGSSCIFSAKAPQPIKEEYFMIGPLEPTNEAYAIAKIAAIKLCRYNNEQYGTNFLSVMPTNLYGSIAENFDLQTSHLLPALIRRFHEAKINNTSAVTLWGTGEPFREFLYVDDLAEVCVYFMNNYDYKDIGEFVNIGTGKDIKIKDLAELVKQIVEFNGEILWDTTKPDGMYKKLLDVSRMNSLGWYYRTELEDGIKKVYEWYRNQ